MPEDKKRDVGQSVARKGENVVKDEGKEAGRHEAGTKGPSERPVGTSTARDATGVGPDSKANTPSADDAGKKKP